MREDLCVSVIIPVLNERDLIAPAVGSAQSAGADEVVVVDGGSADGTIEVAEKQGVQIVSSLPGRGIQQNCGAQTSTGNVLLFLHADCQLSHDTINQVRGAAQFTDAPWGGFEQRIPAEGRMYRWLEKGNSWRARKRKLVYGDQGIWLSRQVFEQVDGFPNIPLMEDVVISNRLRRVSSPIILPGPIVISPRRWKQNGVIRQTLTNWSLYGMFKTGVSPKRLSKFYNAN